MSEINRYNQGFHKFGPMEQCKEGKWVLASDYLELNRRLTVKITEYSDLDIANASVYNQISSLKATLAEETKDNTTMTKLLAKQSRAISILSISITVLAVMQLAQALVRILG